MMESDKTEWDKRRILFPQMQCLFNTSYFERLREAKAYLEPMLSQSATEQLH